jgi:two-component system LytT family sensor kinase
LNSIAALIRLKDNARALEMLVGLGDFMRRNLDDIRDQFVQLSTEIEWVTRYVALQQTRFGDRLDVEYRIDEDCLDVSVPTLLLQPLVENAVRHGAARQTHRCRIVIGATRDRDRLTVWVADDGVGLPADFDLNREAGTGLRNTRSRLEQIYGGGATLEMRRGTPSGTTVVITLAVGAARWHGKATA